jgi:soluble lytic murein transglycosylase
MLILSGNARTVSCIDTIANDSLTRQWIDSLSSKKSLSVYDSLALLRAALLAFCGQSEQSQLFLNTIDTKTSGNLGLLYDLSMLYRQADNVALSNRLARKIAMRVPVNQRAVIPQTFFDLLYPKPYFEIVTREASRNNIDPFIVLAVMRQESVYDPSIVSHAGAIGLMQMMPATGRTVSRAFKESFAADSLYKPYVNIKFGTYYIKQLLEQFHGNLVLAIASYNGGPAKATEWFEKNKKKTFDLFIEDIGFTETRGYVKKVLANYWIYRGYASHILQSKW